jgi:hypothetical protein
MSQSNQLQELDAINQLELEAHSNADEEYLDAERRKIIGEMALVDSTNTQVPQGEGAQASVEDAMVVHSGYDSNRRA